jgi:hypothetical protein
LAPSVSLSLLYFSAAFAAVGLPGLWLAILCVLERRTPLTRILLQRKLRMPEAMKKMMGRRTSGWRMIDG